MNEEQCPMLGGVIVARQIDGESVEIRRCNHFQKSCTVGDHKIHIPSGMMQTCAVCPAKAMLLTQNEPPKKLSTYERVTTAAKVMASTAVTGMADEATIARRLAICKTCPQFEDGLCKLCSCKIVREKVFLNKLAHISSVCPDKINPRW